jgi:DNA ligase (NAD+)
MEPVQLAGTIVKRASLHNADIIAQLDLHLGDYVYVEKAGEIIPQIVGVDTEARSFMPGPKVVFRTTCPECGTPLVRYEGEAAHYCPNDTQCPPQLKGRIEHFISREAMNIDSLGPETVAALFERGILRDAADLYALTIDQLMGMDGTREKSARRLIDGIAQSREVTFDRVLFALGIRFVGKVVAKLLARQFKNIDALQAASLEQLLETEGVGEIIAQSVKEYFSKQDNLDLLERLREAGLQMELPEIQLSSTLLEGMSIVISGTFTHHSREEYKAIIETNGGKNVSSISKKTTFILAGENMGPSKLEKAQKLGVEIVDEDTFLARLNGEA